MYSKTIVVCVLMAMICTVRADEIPYISVYSHSLYRFQNEDSCLEDAVGKCALCRVTVDAIKSYLASEEIIELRKEEIKKLCHHVPLFADECTATLDIFLDSMLKVFSSVSSDIYCAKFHICP
ncbi:hypothetical protein D915_007616 [Fasciola hepatica]|uniref:Saposin B-type domain-containing protein n=1 Tax=Fasciola hepatica TaxID=6192 RepID=A0A4E0R2B4_FASHE|nr:hypothetical protein D915_007616 [Fasciola hepatica]